MPEEKPLHKDWLGSERVSEMLLLGGTIAIALTLLLLFLAAFHPG